MIKIGVFILFVVVSLNGYWWFQSRKQMNRIIDLFENHYPDENFYFLGGLSYSPALFSGVKYRGVLYSDSLKEMEYPGGLYMELTGKSSGVGYIDTYKVLKDVIKIDRLAEEIARDIFGKYTTLTNEFGISRSPENIIKNYGTTLPYEKRSGAHRTVVNVYIEDLEKGGEREYFEKVFKLGKELSDKMNYRTNIAVYLKPLSSLEEVRFLNSTMLSISLKNKEVKKITKKIEKGEKLSDEERMKILESISKNELINTDHYYYVYKTNKKNYKEMKREDVELLEKGGIDWRKSCLIDVNGKRYMNEKGRFEKMVKIGVFILFVVVSLNGYWWFQSRRQMNRIIDLFENHYPDENFYFLGGLSYSPALFSEVKYRGVLYSDSLKEMEYPGGLYMELSGKSNGVGYLDTYKVFKDVIKIDRLAEELARDIFGKYTTLTNEFGISRSPENIIKNYGTTLPYEKRSGAHRTIVNVYIEDLEKGGEREYFEKVFELGKKIAYEMNYESNFAVYLKPLSSLENVEFLNNTMLSISLKNKEVKKITKKIEKGEKLSDEERMKILESISKNELINTEYYYYIYKTNKDDYREMKIEDVELLGKGGIDWRKSYLIDVNGKKIYEKEN